MKSYRIPKWNVQILSRTTSEPANHATWRLLTLDYCNHSPDSGRSWLPTIAYLHISARFSAERLPAVYWSSAVLYAACVPPESCITAGTKGVKFLYPTERVLSVIRQILPGRHTQRILAVTSFAYDGLRGQC
jgi:hypothetical protein